MEFQIRKTASQRMARPGFIVLVLLLLGAPLAHAAERFALRNSVSARATAARWLRGADPDESLEMSVTLQLRRTNELAGLLVALQDPGSPLYHQWLTPDGFVARFGPSPGDYNAAVDWLQQEGFVINPKASSGRIDFRGTVANVERTFGVRMNHYSHRGRTPLANDSPPLLPPQFRDTVAFIRLNTFPLAEPLLRLESTTGPFNTMAPSDMYTAYDMRSLLDAGVNGAGQTIAVVARSDFKLSDVASFATQFGVGAGSPVKAFPSTNPGIGAPAGACEGIHNQHQLQDCLQGEEAEVLLDTEWASAMAPGATVLVDISGADIDLSLLDIVTHHPEAKTITMSFGSCERLDSSDLSLFGPMYAQAAAQGQTVLVATGDDGADECQDGHGASVNVLASDENVIAVGGTALNPGFDMNGDATGFVSERVWNDSTGASGGGASTLVAKPSYQSVAGVPADWARDQPDVALLASPSTAGYVVVIEGAIAVIGGTSAATPSWAGIVAMLNQATRADGAGALNPLLYTLGRQQYAQDGAAVFHDITSGNNTFDHVSGYSAGPGYDLSTGLGTPDVAVLAQALVALVSPPATPSPPPQTNACVGDCNNDQVVTVDEILTLVNISLGRADISVCPAGDANHDGQITVDEMVDAVNNAINGCSG